MILPRPQSCPGAGWGMPKRAGNFGPAQAAQPGQCARDACMVICVHRHLRAWSSQHLRIPSIFYRSSPLLDPPPACHAVNLPDTDACSTSALAYWRYAHDYVRTVRCLAKQHCLPYGECQALYHLCAQALEFALKAVLRAQGVAAREVAAVYDRAIERTLAACMARGLRMPPGPVLAAMRRLAGRHRPEGFIVRDAAGDAADLAPGCAAVCWVLDVSVALVAEDYSRHYAAPGSPTAEAFIARLRADLSATCAGDLLPA